MSVSLDEEAISHEQSQASIEHLIPSAASDVVSPHIARDEHGTITYHGPTSRFHAETISDASLESATGLRESLYRSHAQAFENNTELMRHVWEPMLKTKTEQELGVPPEVVKELLDVYWIWQHPLHNCVYKPCQYSIELMPLPPDY